MFFKKNDTNAAVLETLSDTFSCPAHEEADTKIIYHLCKVNRAASVMIICSNTDILVILLGNYHKIHEGTTVWISTGTKKNYKMLNVTKLHEELGDSVCKSLPAFHAFTGCDYNSSFYNKGKLRPFKKLCDSIEYLHLFENFGDKLENLEDDFNKVQTFVCDIYNCKPKRKHENINVNSARLATFLKCYKVTNIQEPFSKKSLKKFDASSLPPSEVELKQHYLRAIFVATIWKNADKKDPQLTENSERLSPENFGWIKENDAYNIQWFKGLQIPEPIEDIVAESDGEISFYYHNT